MTIMESVGMTRKQLYKMLTLEGIYYCLCLTACMATVGSLILWILGKVIQNNLAYFVFDYPGGALLIISCSFMVLCTSIPRLIFHRTLKESVTTRLKRFQNTI